MTDHKSLKKAVGAVGFVEDKELDSSGHIVFKRNFKTVVGKVCQQRVTVSSTPSDEARGWKNAVRKFNKKERERIELSMP